MNRHTLQALEFHRIRDLLVARASSIPGRERAASVAPGGDPDAVRETLALVAEALSLQSEPGWPRLAMPDLRPALARARVEGSALEAADFLDLARTLALARECGRFFATSASRASRPRLAAHAARLFTAPEYEERVARTFEPSGELSDAASPELRRLRRERLRLQHEAGARLEELGRSLHAAEDSVVTLRGGRYVLSVSAAERRRVKGIVHDRSATGRTVYLEPLEVIELNNGLAELEADERQEQRRILLELSAWVRARAELLAGSVDALARIDEFDARARLARDLRASAPAIDERAATLRIVDGRHPLLYLAIGERTVPLDLTLEGEVRGLVVSGPNMGGKTVVLKTAGLMVAMALAGLFVPAREGTVIPWIDDALVDIGDEQSLESDLSTYGARLRNMEAMLESATRRTLVLIDELGAGTDPEEGAALGQALLAEMARRGAFCVVTTHHGAFKSFAAEAPGFENGAVEHDPETLRPTFRLRIGLPGRSHAFELARRERWPAAILERARALLSSEAVRAEELLARIDAHRAELERAREQLARREAELAAEQERLRKLADGLREKTEAVRLATALEEDRRLREIRETLQTLRARLEDLDGRLAGEDLRELRRWVHARERETAVLAKSQRPIPRQDARHGQPLSTERLARGTRAYARSLGVDVEIEDRAPGGNVWVLHKGIRIELPARDLVSVSGTEETAARESTSGEGTGAAGGTAARRAALRDEREEAQALVGAEIDLRGTTAEECRARLDLYLDRALLAGYPRVRIIHGKGGGVLRRVVREMVRDHPLVRAFRDGEPPEGGWGVTIALLGSGGPEDAAGSDRPGAARAGGEGAADGEARHG